MPERSLAIELRPQTLKELVGQEAVHRQIVQLGPKPIAWMFAGPPGVGKTTTARILALSYQDPDGKFGEPSKKLRKARNDYDIQEVNAAHFRGVEDIERLVDVSQYIPRPPTRRRVIILDEAQRMSAPAQNMLLQPFESGHAETTVWMICTTDPGKIIKALQDRCTKIRLHPLRAADVRELASTAGAAAGLKPKRAKKLAEALLVADVTSPRLIVQAAERMAANGGDAEAAATGLGDELEGVDTLAICRAVADHKTKELAAMLKDLPADATDPVLRSVLGYLRAVILGGGPRLQRLAACDTVERLAGITYLDDHAKRAAMAAILMRGAK